MFPSKGPRKEMRWRQISCLQNGFPFLPQIPLNTPHMEHLRVGYGSQSGVPTTTGRCVCCSGFSSSLCIKKSFKNGTISLRHDSQSELLKWQTAPALNYEKLFVYKQEKKQKGLHGYFHWFNALNPVGGCVGWGSVTQCWLAWPDQIQSRAKGHSNNRHICFCWQPVQHDNGA